MKTIDEIIRDYTTGEATTEETNEALKEAGAPYHFIPGQNDLTEADMRSTTVGYYPDQANGFGLLDSGTGTMEKMRVTAGKLEYAVNSVHPDGTTNMLAFFHICGKKYEVKGDMLAAME